MHGAPDPRPLVPAPSVRCAGDDEHLVLLDLASGEYSMLNATGAAVWRRLQAGVPPARAAHHLAAETGAAVTETRREVEELVRHLEAEGLLVAAPANGDGSGHRRSAATPPPAAGPPLAPPSPPPRPSVRATLVAWVLLVRVRRLAARRGFAGLLAALPPCPPDDADPVGGSGVAATVAATAAAVDRAAALQLRKAWCLPLSAACTWMLRRRGVPARLVLGVRPLPFFAHAWVEVGGRPIDDGHDVGKLAVLDRF